ncbi:MAG: hypothetical protein SFW67_36060 [Myxococcaceae bacterium]|nr:hypothetical protein [Myxococcaceae bacterium]
MTSANTPVEQSLAAMQVAVDRLLELGARVKLTTHRPATARALEALRDAWQAPLPVALEALLSVSDGLALSVEVNDERRAWSLASTKQLAVSAPRPWRRSRVVHLGVDAMGRSLLLPVSKRRAIDPPLVSLDLPGPTLRAFLDAEAQWLSALLVRVEAARAFPQASFQHVRDTGVGFASVTLDASSRLQTLAGLGVKSLALTGLDAHDLTALASMPTLEELAITCAPGAWLRSLPRLPSVQRLMVRLDRVEDLDWLEHVPNAWKLELFVGALPPSLEVVGRQVTDLRLSGFFAQARQTRRLERLVLPSALRSLELHHLDLERLPALEGLKALTQLSIHGNAMPTIDLPALPRLENLMLGFNQLTEVRGLERARTTTRLDVSQNALRRLPLEPLTALRELDASQNALDAVPFLPPSLREANLAKNPIRSFDALTALGPTTAVDLRGTGLSPAARRAVEAGLRAGPRLRWLDAG